jgi:predicted nucleotide-binding protein (sugar kinase/HSP70/actin superfamily)
MGVEIPPFDFKRFKRFIMKNDSYDRAKEKARKERLKKRVEWINTDWSDKVKNSDINIQLKSIKELADEIKELTGRK